MYIYIYVYKYTNNIVLHYIVLYGIILYLFFYTYIRYVFYDMSSCPMRGAIGSLDVHPKNNVEGTICVRPQVRAQGFPAPERKRPEAQDHPLNCVGLSA